MNSRACQTPKSWNPTKAPRTHRQKLRRALRNALDEQIATFKKSAQEVCEICRSSEDLTADHFPEPFEQLALSFLSTLPTQEETPVVFRESRIRLQDASLEQRWMEHHRANAHLRTLCRSCNSRTSRQREKKADSTEEASLAQGVDSSQSS